jgi:protein-S-isoprenylcysteine O-methyltransferase Ste14
MVRDHEMTAASLKQLARLRVPLGFACAIFAFWLAQPTPASLAVGAVIATAGELLRIWAAGHIEKGREITRSGPYRYVRHPLYLGSSLMALGFIIAARSVAVGVLVSAYMLITLLAAIRTEEASLDEKFAGQYSVYRSGAAAPVMRHFSVTRAVANREYRSMTGLAVGMIFLYLRAKGMVP